MKTYISEKGAEVMRTFFKPREKKIELDQDGYVIISEENWESTCYDTISTVTRQKSLQIIVVICVYIVYFCVYRSMSAIEKLI